MRWAKRSSRRSSSAVKGLPPRSRCATIAPHRARAGADGRRDAARDVLGHHAGRDRIGAPERGVVVDAGRAPGARHLGRLTVTLLREPRPDRGRRAEAAHRDDRVLVEAHDVGSVGPHPAHGVLGHQGDDRVRGRARAPRPRRPGAAPTARRPSRRSPPPPPAAPVVVAALRRRVPQRHRHLGGESRTTSRSTHSAGPPGHTRPGLVAARLTVGQRPGATSARAGSAHDGGHRLAEPATDGAPSNSGPARVLGDQDEVGALGGGGTAWSTHIASRLAASAAARRSSPASDFVVHSPPPRALT